MLNRRYKTKLNRPGFLEQTSATTFAFSELKMEKTNLGFGHKAVRTKTDFLTVTWLHPRNQHIFLLSSPKAVLQSALIQHLRKKKVQKLILSASLFCFALFCHFVAFTHIQMDVALDQFEPCNAGYNRIKPTPARVECIPTVCRLPTRICLSLRFPLFIVTWRIHCKTPQHNGWWVIYGRQSAVSSDLAFTCNPKWKH